MSLQESKSMSFSEFDKEYEKTESRRANSVYVEKNKSEIVVVDFNGEIKRNSYMKENKKDTYVKFAIPVTHEDKPKSLEVFFDEVAAVLKAARASGDGRVTVSKNNEGRYTFA